MGVKISELTEAIAVQDTDVLPIVQDGETKKISSRVLFAKLQTQIESLISQINNKNLIYTYLNSQWNISANNTYVKVPLTTLTASIGNKLTNNNDSIVIGSGISKVKVSARLGIIKNANGLVYIRIGKNGITDNFSSNQVATANSRTEITTEGIFEVSEGDTISLYTYGSTSDVVTPGGGMSYLIVEALD